jgi:hypothetical protein
MTLKITDVVFARYEKDNRVSFYVLCEGLEGFVDTSIQSGESNAYNNEILEGWLSSNTPDPYDSTADDTVAELDALQDSIRALDMLSPLDLATKTATEVESLAAQKLSLLQDMSTKGALLQQLADDQKADIESRVEAYRQNA